MAEFHFVEDYERFVEQLVAQHPIDEAMSLAVGGGYEAVGQIEADIMRHAGLRSGMSLLDMGCGSGRLAAALGKSGLRIDYTGVDVVARFLSYAATKTPAYYIFLLHRGLTIPAETASLDFVAGFSLFTHLLHHETYLYMQDAARALRSGGVLVFSFLEFAEEAHWPIFLNTVDAARTNTNPHLNTFIERGAIEKWADRLGFSVSGYLGPSDAAGPNGALGQSTAMLRRA